MSQKPQAQAMPDASAAGNKSTTAKEPKIQDACDELRTLRASLRKGQPKGKKRARTFLDGALYNALMICNDLGALDTVMHAMIQAVAESPDAEFVACVRDIYNFTYEVRRGRVDPAEELGREVRREVEGFVLEGEVMELDSGGVGVWCGVWGQVRDVW